MTAKEIKKTAAAFSTFGPMEESISKAIYEVAFQLAVLNQYNARMEARYMALTAPAVKRGRRKQELPPEKP